METTATRHREDLIADTFREAAARGHAVQFIYRCASDEGRIEVRHARPISVRENRSGRAYVRAIDVDGNGFRSFSLDRVADVLDVVAPARGTGTDALPLAPALAEIVRGVVTALDASGAEGPRTETARFHAGRLLAELSGMSPQHCDPVG